MRPGDIYLTYFPFGDTPGSKLRPALLLTSRLGEVPEILVAYISSVVPSALLETDIVVDPQLDGFKSTNLKVRSAIRLHKLATLHVSNLARRLGSLEGPAQAIVRQKMKILLNL